MSTHKLSIGGCKLYSVSLAFSRMYIRPCYFKEFQCDKINLYGFAAPTRLPMRSFIGLLRIWLKMRRLRIRRITVTCVVLRENLVLEMKKIKKCNCKGNLSPRGICARILEILCLYTLYLNGQYGISWKVSS